MDEVRENTPRLSSEPADRLWADLGSDDAAAMHRASWVLAAAGEEAVSLMAERLEPVPMDSGQLGGELAHLARPYLPSPVAITPSIVLSIVSTL